MIKLQFTFDHAPIEKSFRGTRRLVKAHTRRRLSYWGRQHIKYIRGHRSVFKYKEGRQGRTSAPLLNSMWTKRKKSREPTQLIGWGLPHGEVLEFGPKRVFTWEIVPKGFRSDISFGAGKRGVALKFLRFKVGGKIRYAKKVVHRWTTAELRPHVEPSLIRHERGFLQDMGSITKRVIEGRLT